MLNRILAQTVRALAVSMETLWIYAWLQAIGLVVRPEGMDDVLAFWPDMPFGLPGAFVVAVGATLTYGWVAQARLAFSGKATLLACVGLALVATTYLATAIVESPMRAGVYAPDAFKWSGASAIAGGAVFGLIFVWRGFDVASKPTTSALLRTHLMIGLVAMVVMLALDNASWTANPDALTTHGWCVVAIAAVGMLAQALLTIKTSFEAGDATGGGDGHSRRSPWLALAGVSAVVVVAFGVIASSVFSFDVGRAFIEGSVRVAQWTVLIFVFAVATVLSIVFGVLRTLWGVVLYLIGLLGDSEATIYEPIEFPTLGDLPVGAQNPDQGVPGAEFIIAAVIAIVLVYLLWRTLARLRRNARIVDPDQVRESLWSRDAVIEDFLSLARRLPGLGRSPGKPRPPIASTNDSRMLTVREIYQGLQWEGRAVGIGRSSDETPLEYQGKLAETTGGVSPDLAAVTDAYNATRYGEKAAGEDALSAINQAWRRLKASLRETGTERGRNA